MKDTNKLNPEIRFSGFTDDWEQRKLGDTKTHFTDGNYGESYPSAKDMSDKENGVPFLRGSDFSNGYLDSSNANYIRPEKHAELTSGHIQQDDIILAVRGSLGTLGYATQENEGWNINSQLAILRTNKSEILGKFLIQYLLGSKGQKEILSRNTGTALKQLPIKQLKDIPVPMPILEEQQKIGNFFKQLDDTITLHQRKLNGLKNVKKAMLEKMFPKNGESVPEIRFSGFTDDWERRKFPEFVEFYNGLTYSPDDVRASGTLVLRSSNVKNGEIVDADNVYVEPDKATSENVKEGDIIVVVRNGSRALIGKHAEIKESMSNTVIGAFMSGIRSEHSSFVNALLDTNQFEKEIEKNMGATINQITGYMFSKMEFTIPSPTEQDKIGNYFKYLDRLITLHQRKLDKLKTLKKAMLEKMFI